jgi:ankyrin repeat protein
METQTASWLEVMDDNGETPSTRALKSGSFTLTEVICAYEERCQRSDNPSAIHAAAAKGDDETLEECIRLGQDVDAMDEHGETPLHVAVREGQEMTVMTLLHAGASSALRDGVGLLPIHWAVLKGCPGLVLLLLQYGADVNGRDDFGAMTPFTYAKLLDYKELARLLSRHGGTW